MTRRYIEDSAAFDPDTVEAMAAAVAEICRALRILDGDARGREAIAVRIVALAKGGLRSADALRDRVLLESRAVA